MVPTKITHDHGSDMGIGSFDSSQCKSTLVWDPGTSGLLCTAGGSACRHGMSCRQLFHIAGLALCSFYGKRRLTHNQVASTGYEC